MTENQTNFHQDFVLFLLFYLDFNGVFFFFNVSQPSSNSSSRIQVAKLEQFSHWKLYLVDWGYNTKAERERAERNDRIQVISIKEFEELSKKK